MLKKIMVIALVVTMIAAALPVINASAAPFNDDPPPAYGKNAAPRLERAYQRLQTWYQKQGEFLSKSGNLIARAEKFIAKANERGLDTSSLQALLNDFSKSIPAVQSAHDRTGAILSAHNGFDGAGKVTDIQAAIRTVKDAAAALQEGRQAHLGKGKALAQAIRAFWQANKPPHPSSGTNFVTPVPTEP